MIGRREEHVRAVGEDDGLQDVDRLREVRHDDAPGVAVENVQRQRRDHRVAHGVLLIEEAGVRAGLDVVPAAPFVDDQADAVLGVVAVHNGQMAADEVVHVCGLAHRFGIQIRAEIRRAALILPRAGDGVVVQRDRVHEAPRVFHQNFGPVPVVHACAAGDAVEPVLAVIAAVGLIAAVDVGVIFGAHVAAAAPAFVAYAPVADVERRVVPVRAALHGDGGVGVAVEILDPLGHLLHRAGADVGVDIRLASDLAAKLHEFVRAEGVILHHAAPVGVDHTAASRPGADSVAPVVFVGEAAAGPAQDGNLQLFQRFDNVRAHAVDVGDRRILADVEPAVNAAAQMLGEVAVNVAVDLRARMRRVDGDDCGHTISLLLNRIL